LNAERVDRPGELLTLTLRADQHRYGEPLLGEAPVDFNHPPRLLLSLLLRGMGSVPFLPEELGRAQEQARAHLPAHHVAPLIDEQRQVAVTLDPVAISIPDDRLGGGADDQLLIEPGLGIDLDAAIDRAESMVRDHRAFLGEAFGHRLFTLE